MEGVIAALSGVAPGRRVSVGVMTLRSDRVQTGVAAEASEGGLADAIRSYSARPLAFIVSYCWEFLAGREAKLRLELSLNWLSSLFGFGGRVSG